MENPRLLDSVSVLSSLKSQEFQLNHHQQKRDVAG
jgi:hypothetical protein